MIRVITACLMVLLAASASRPPFDTDTLPVDRVLMPANRPDGVVVLISGKDGWSEKEQDVADQLLKRHAVVVGVDLQDWYEKLASKKKDCHYLVADIENLNRQIHRSAGMNTYRTPIVAGMEDGGMLALAIAAQTPAATIGATVAVDPNAVVPLETVLCTPAPKTAATGGTIYGLTDGALPDPVTVSLGETASKEGRDNVAAIKAKHSDIWVKDQMDGSAVDRLAHETKAALDRIRKSGSPLDLPIVALEATPKLNTMAVIYSGDGGWRDIDKQLANYLQEDGVPVVGVDALRYFWEERSVEHTAADLSHIIETYKKKWKVDHVILVGYSFGANILPITYNNLPPQDRASVQMLSLIAPSHKADFQISVMGWFGAQGQGTHGDPAEHMAQIEPRKVQCIYGTAEADDSACTGVTNIAGVQVLPRPGGHHFDGDYRPLAKAIIERSKALSLMN
ncbi:virulence factor family protein [Rhizobium oryzicola]|uniref:AcvB/VirJ family lysyl-phosphatidylglycerol hydrolase n=1 Tax=Rhizobium oryzicola TaxID=1232668 RepID=A0ABT8SU00_9HYPH|nr:AcvB/VirJ family lysyl-phosphatidylglycerol hydrolase [Rhizobium oryzicola]MDO1581378.1 AcvB/VirJ family lysyl-phosphatidylglycerol hydrolase [Rhizobium oryzicola]